MPQSQQTHRSEWMSVIMQDRRCASISVNAGPTSDWMHMFRNSSPPPLLSLTGCVGVSGLWCTACENWGQIPPPPQKKEESVVDCNIG